MTILKAFHRPHIDPLEIIHVLRREGVSPELLQPAQLEEEVRWVVMFRIEFDADCIPGWRANVFEDDDENETEDDFFE
jgi:hypothetical protein